MANLGPLTTIYSANGTNCNSIYQTNGDMLIYGTTSASISSCMPTSFVPWDGKYYSPGICPSGYTYACTAGLGDGGTAATCCPTGYECRTGRVTADPAACGSLMQSASSFTINQYLSTGSITASTTITTFYTAGNWIFANGVVVRRAGNDPAWSTTGLTSPTSTLIKQSTASPQSSSSSTEEGTDNKFEANSGLSSGAKVGIGVGVALGVLSIIGMIVGAFLIGKGKRQAAQEGTLKGSQQHAHTASEEGWDQPVRPLELDEQRGCSELSTHHYQCEAVELGSQ